jgi:hypothetical protein
MVTDREPRIAYRPEITLGSIFIVVGMIVSATVYIVSDHWKATDAADQGSALSKQIEGVKADSARQNERLSNKIDAMGAQIQNQIASLPDQNARVGALERRMVENDAHNVAQDGRIGTLEQSSSRRPAHLLIGAHSAVQWRLHRALGWRRRYRLLAVPRRRIVGNHRGLSDDVRLKSTQHSSDLARGRGRCIESRQGVADEIERSPHLAVPQAPADVVHCVGEAGAVLSVFIGDVRPVFERLRDVLDAHGEMKPVKHMTGRTDARRLAKRPRPVCPIAQDGDRGAWRPAKTMQNAAQLLSLSIGLDRYAAEDDLLAIVVADLRHEHLESPHLIAAHSTHVT